MQHQPQYKWFGDWETSTDVDFDNDLSQRFLRRNTFKTEEAYHRSLAFFHLVQKDIMDFNHSAEIHEILPPLISAVFLPKIEARIAASNHIIPPIHHSLPIIRSFDMYAEIGWLLEVEQLLLSAKMTFMMLHIGHSAAFGKETWGSVSGDDFANCFEDVQTEFDSWSLSSSQQNSFHVGRITASVRLDSLSAMML